MKVLSFFILSGCKDLHFTDEDIHNETPSSKVTKEETREEADSFDAETLSPKNQKEISLLIEERESVSDTRETENLKTPIAKKITESFGGEVKISITDSSLKPINPLKVKSALPNTPSKTIWELRKGQDFSIRKVLDFSWESK